MRWFEIIELRHVNNKRKILEADLKSLIEELNTETDQPTISIYSRIAEDSEFCIHFHHNSKCIKNNGSQLGLQLVSTLKDYGLINHKVWVEHLSK